MFIIFCTIRPRNNVVYAPRLKYSDEKSRPQQLSKHPFAWIKYVLFKATEQDYLEKAGLDAVIYIRFTTMCRNIFAVLSLFAVLVILPINVIYNRKNPQASILSAKDAFILTTPILISGRITVAHVTLAYIFDFIVLYFLWANYEQVIALRRKVFMSEAYQNALYMRTLLLTEVPKKYKVDDQGLINLMHTMKTQRPIQNATVGRDVGQLVDLIESYNKTVKHLESVLAKYFKHPDNLPAVRPQIKPYKNDTKYKSAKRNKVDAIDYLLERMQRLESEIYDARDYVDTKKTLPYGFVSYESVEDCNIVAHAIDKQKFGKHGLRITLAPRPEDIIWENIILTKSGRRNKQFWGNVFFIVMMILWIVPNAFLGAFLSQLSRIGVLWHPFSTFIIRYPILFSIVQGIIAPLVTSMIFLLMPALMRKMSHWQGKVTKTDRETDVTKKLYLFFVFNNVFVFTLFSVVWSIVVQIINIVNTQQDLSFSKVITEISLAYKISTAVMGASSFWIMYILRVNFGAVLDLLQLFSLLWRGFQRHFMSPTPRQQMMWTAPQHFAYASYYNWLLFYSTIALSFAMIQPLVILVVTLYFAVDILYKKYGLMYIFVTKAESDGQFWPLLFNSFLFATVFGNLVLFVVVWAQGGWRIAAGMAPLLVIIIIFKIVSNARHRPRFNYFIPTEKEKMEIESLRTRTCLSDVSSLALARKYRNPVIDCNLIVPMVHSKAQHLLAQISNVNYNHDDADPDTVFRSFDDNVDVELGDISYEHTRDNDLFGGEDGYRNNKGPGDAHHHIPRRRVLAGNRSSFLDGRFDIVSDEDLNYSHLQFLERAETAVPDDQNPYLNSGLVASHNKPDTSNDAAIAAAMATNEGLAPYHTQLSVDSSETFIGGSNYGNGSRRLVSGSNQDPRYNYPASGGIQQSVYPEYETYNSPPPSIYPVQSVPSLRGHYSSENLVRGTDQGDLGNDHRGNQFLLNPNHANAEGYPHEGTDLRVRSSRENLLDNTINNQHHYPQRQQSNRGIGKNITRGYSRID